MSKTRFIAAVVAGLLAFVACGGDAAEPRVTTEETEDQGPASYEDNGVAFDYPSDWDEFPAEASATSTGSNELWSATIGPDKTNLVNVTAYQLKVEVTDENLDSIEAELDEVITDVVDQAGGEISSGPTPEEVAGFPAYTYEWTGVEVDGEPKDSSAYFVFNGDIEYFFNCQFSDETAEEIRDGCRQVLDTFAVTDSA